MVNKTEQTEIKSKRMLKLSVKNIYGKITPPQHGEAKHIMTIGGVAVGYRPVTTDKGDSIELHGDFKALRDGKVFLARKCFLPSTTAETIAEALNKEQGATIRFAYKIDVVQHDGPMGYAYDVQTLMMEDTSQMMLEVDQLMQKALT